MNSAGVEPQKLCVSSPVSCQQCQQQAWQLAGAPYLPHKLQNRTRQHTRVSSATICSLSPHFRRTHAASYIQDYTAHIHHLFTHFTRNTSSDDATPRQHKRHFTHTKHRPTRHTLRALSGRDPPGGITYIDAGVCIHTYIHTYSKHRRLRGLLVLGYKVKVNFTLYRPRRPRWGWVVNAMPRPLYPRERPMV
jgi:hypothetical protein